MLLNIRNEKVKIALVSLTIVAIVGVLVAIYYFVFLPKSRIKIIETATAQASNKPNTPKTALGGPVSPLTVRVDSQGDGHYQSSRSGGRSHKGVDLRVKKGQNVVSPVDGLVERMAYPYPKDLKWEGLYLKGNHGIDVKIFYIEPLTGIVGKSVKRGDRVGIAQKISDKYNAQMLDHIHVEAWVKGGAVNPEPLFGLTV